MIIDTICTQQLEAFHHQKDMLIPSDKQLASLIDLTCLNKDASADELTTLFADAQKFNVAAVCTFETFLSKAPKDFPIRLATVINFPVPNESTSTLLTTIDRLHQQYAINEIDYVFPYHWFLDGEINKAIDHAKIIMTHCESLQITSKIIIESGVFPSTEKLFDAACRLLETPCTFLKTSTGVTYPGVNEASATTLVRAMMHVRPAGIKFSGGVKTKEDAIKLYQLTSYLTGRLINQSWIRIGASRLISELNPV